MPKLTPFDSLINVKLILDDCTRIQHEYWPSMFSYQRKHTRSVYVYIYIYIYINTKPNNVE
jgi:hypothetical protein